MTAATAIICGLFGLVVGSFLNVVIWRVPRQESVVVPASHCPSCDAPTRDRTTTSPSSRGWCCAPAAGTARRRSRRAIPRSSCSPALLFAAIGRTLRRLVGAPRVPRVHGRPRSRSRSSISSTSSCRTACSIPSGSSRCRCCFGRRAARRRRRCVRRRAARRRGGVRRLLRHPHRVAARAWASATCGSRSSSGASSAASAGGTCSSGCSPASSTAPSSAWRWLRSGKPGGKQHIPFGPFLAAGTMTIVLFGEPLDRLVPRQLEPR